ncbi:MAG: hypothetical protein KGI71_06150 [Patescibacteria group bacterium]|nr:hypothetical protein [Patescibacteria group bacterium]
MAAETGGVRMMMKEPVQFMVHMESEHLALLRKLAAKQRVTVSRLAREIILDRIVEKPVVVPQKPLPDPNLRNWRKEIDALEQFSGMEAIRRLQALAAGRPLPANFYGWDREKKIKWLESNWPT